MPHVVTPVSETITDAAAVLYVVHLGPQPELRRLGCHLAALDDIWAQGAALAAMRSEPEPDPLEPRVGRRVRHERVSPAVIRVSLRSPLEVILASATTSAAPIAYGLAAILFLERAVKLLMAWQRHRAELFRQSEIQTREVEVRSLFQYGGDLDPMLEELIELPERLSGPPVLEVQERVSEALIRLALERIVRMERLDRQPTEVPEP